MKTLTALLVFSVIAFAQVPPDCQWTDTFTSAVAGPDHANTSGGANPCVVWRVTYDTVGMTGVSLQLEGAPWNSGGTGAGTYTPISAIAQGTNPLISPDCSDGLCTLVVEGIVYYPWIRVNTTVFTPTGATGKITVRVYGYKGTSSSATGGTVTGGPFTSGNVIVGAGGQAIADSTVPLANLVPYTGATGDVNISPHVFAAGGGSANMVVCWKSDGITLGYATVAEITAGTCH